MFSNELWQKSGVSTYSIDQSIRFNDGDSAYMHRTPSGAGDRRTFTYSVWFKLGDMATTQRMLLSVRNSDTTRDNIMINQGGAGDYRIYFDARVGGSAHTELEPTRALRDPSAWHHLVVSVDTTNAVSTERVRLYLNGARETAFTTQTLPSLNQQFQINNTDKHSIGRFEFSSPQSYWDGYMAEMVMIDGQALDPSSFGEYNSSNIWIPIDVCGLTFGTNGFHIDGRDSADLGDDESGQGNDFTTSGLAAHDQVSDSPTNNFCTINPIYADQTGANDLTLTEGNLEAAGTSSSFDMKGFTFNVPKSGKWYMEYTIGGGYDGFGFCVVGQEGTITPSGNGLGQLSVSQGGGIQYNGWRNGGSVTVTMATFTSGHIHQVAIDVDNGKFYYGIQDTYYAADGGTDGNPSAGTNHTSTFNFAGNDVVLMTAVTTDSNPEHWNFGQNGTFNGTKTAQGNSDGGGVGNFYYAVPTGYKALCTKNLGS